MQFGAVLTLTCKIMEFLGTPRPVLEQNLCRPPPLLPLPDQNFSTPPPPPLPDQNFCSPPPCATAEFLYPPPLPDQNFCTLAPALCQSPHCTVLHCSALHGTVLHCPALCYTAVHCCALHYARLHCSALRCNALHCPAMHRNTLHCAAHVPFLVGSTWSPERHTGQANILVDHDKEWITITHKEGCSKGPVQSLL